MKKFILWFIPKAWYTIEEKHEHVCKHTYIDAKTLTDPENRLYVMEVSEEKAALSEALGITAERADFLEKECKKAVIDSKNTIEAMMMMNKHFKHANELYFCSVNINERANSQHGMSGLLGALLAGRGGPGGFPGDPGTK